MCPTKSGEGLKRPWLDHYPNAVSKNIKVFHHSCLGDLFEGTCKQFPRRIAFSCMGKTMSYCEFEDSSRSIAAWLLSRGLEKGDRVALMMPNILQFPVVFAGILRAGLVAVNVNPLYTPRELRHQMKDSGAKAIFVLENFAHTVEDVLPDTNLKDIIVTSMGDQMGGLKGMLVNFVVRRVKKMVPNWSIPGHHNFTDVLNAGHDMKLQPHKVELEDMAILQYTGGTTGVSKGAVLTHRNVLANAEQNREWIKAVDDLPEEMVYICALPLYHIFALTVNFIMGIDEGAHNVLIPNPRDIPSFVKELEKHQFNIFPGLNTLFNALLNNEDFRKLDFSGLRLTLGGGMAVQRPVAERWQKITGCPIHEGYGLSETSPVATANRFDAKEFSGTIGLPLPSTDITIRDEEGNDLGFGEVGEICIRGPQVMKEYWNRPDETAMVLSEDGFFRSGDMGVMDENGYTKIVDRKKDMILVSGFNVYPNEVEEVAVAHPGILEAAAIGVPDDHSGEAVKLFVVRADPNLTSKEVSRWCHEEMTNYKCPKHIEFRDELPKSNVGKILRRELRDMEN